MKYFIYSLIVLVLAGCATTPHSSIQSSDQDEVMFAILGYINEYNGRSKGCIESPEIMGSYGSNNPQNFEDLLKSYCQLNGYDYSAVEKEDSMMFRNQWLSRKINSHYILHDQYPTYTVNKEYILSGSVKHREAYIESILDAYSSKQGYNLLSIANSPLLTETIIEVLLSLGSQRVDLYYSVFDEMPSSEYILFSIPIEGFELKPINREKSLPDGLYKLAKTYTKNLRNNKGIVKVEERTPRLSEGS